MKTAFTLFVLSLLYLPVKAQLPADTVPASINTKIEDDAVRFEAELRPLRQIAGAPEPFYSYFWEFGDGGYSFEKDPVHAYKEGGNYNVRLYATNNYDDGKPPPTRPKKVEAPKAPPSKLASLANPQFLKSEGAIELKSNRMPRPTEEMVLLVGYRNKQEWGISELSGKLLILFNEKQFSRNNFAFLDARTHHQERVSSLNQLVANLPKETITEDWKQKGGQGEVELNKSKKKTIPFKDKTQLYRDNLVWQFNNLKQGEERFMFISLKTTPDMLQDTNAVVSISGVFVPDNPFVREESFDLQLQIVASHDPNKMMLRNSRMNYRFTGRHRELSYKIRFQNTGKGPAKKVEISVPNNKIFDAASLKISKTQPACLPCSQAYQKQSCIDTLVTTDSIKFVFRNIYLPGVKQKGVTDHDSTKGFVEYDIRFAKKPKKLPFSSQAAIVFDKNEPIYTNKSTGQFKRGLSPGIIAVYGNATTLLQHVQSGGSNFSLGFSLSPYSPFKKFLQYELYLSTFKEIESLLDRSEGGDTIITRVPYHINYKETRRISKLMSIDAIPVQLRYNVNKFVGAGAGAMISVNLNSVDKDVRNISATEVKTGETTMVSKDTGEQKHHFTDWNASLFADVQLGKVRVGPALGLRYYQALNGSNNRFSSYLTWKF